MTALFTLLLATVLRVHSGYFAVEFPADGVMEVVNLSRENGTPLKLPFSTSRLDHEGIFPLIALIEDGEKCYALTLGDRVLLAVAPAHPDLNQQQYEAGIRHWMQQAKRFHPRDFTLDDDQVEWLRAAVQRKKQVSEIVGALGPPASCTRRQGEAEFMYIMSVNRIVDQRSALNEFRVISFNAVDGSALRYDERLEYERIAE